jgi:hypothetical protein
MVDGAVYPSHRVFQVHNISDVDTILIEPASCAAHGMDRIAPKLGSKVLLFGAGLTGLVLAQMLRLYGASHLVIAAPDGHKMDLVRSLDGHSTVQMNMSNFVVPKKQRKQLVRTYKARTRTVLILLAWLLEAPKSLKIQSTSRVKEESLWRMAYIQMMLVAVYRRRKSSRRRLTSLVLSVRSTSSLLLLTILLSAHPALWMATE